MGIFLKMLGLAEEGGPFIVSPMVCILDSFTGYLSELSPVTHLVAESSGRASDAD
jgi:hypothetical protein